MKRVVAVGGGTGMPILIRGLLKVFDTVDAIVTVADDGGSSGRLRGEMDAIPPGDSRNCLVAMANGSMMSRLFQYRFVRGEGLKTHALGNLIIAALTDMTGDFNQALAAAGELVGAKGRVLPPALTPLTLYADVETHPSGDGVERVVGQCNVANRLRPLRSIGIEPVEVQANPAAVAAIGQADAIILGPGSLFTSIIANLLVKGIGEAIRSSAARRFFLCNITVQPGETDGMSAVDHVGALLDHAGAGTIDTVVTSDTYVAPARLAELVEAKSPPLIVAGDAIKGLGVDHLAVDLTDNEFSTHHDSDKLAKFFGRLLDSER